MVNVKKEAQVDALIEDLDLDDSETDAAVMDALQKVYGDEYFGAATAAVFKGMSQKEVEEYLAKEELEYPVEFLQPEVIINPL